ncbi:2-hydroxyhepta-2,4-diene-1,7-dioate isomerase [Fulvitalea axinellae]|uniref:2-hydroxyhepta-2,4-diene-1,7-dioate isomerase n=1 Tax=Fulvitalea axinellae TaxID=1182444 RepID=A0AAU9CIR6_9BACT|nr:2-hydroxyhepta-2,4-diene-1,7-dioate isomerase [Fulvitalea axinellae]
MKIIAIGRNYAEHIKELNNERPEEPVIFTKPDTAILRKNNPFYIPDYTKDVHYEVEVVIRIDREGKSVHPKFAHKYYSQIGLGIDFTARDIQAKAKEKGLPWDIAKGFNSSAPISDFYPKEEFGDLQNLDFSLEKNGEIVQQGNTSDMLWPIDEIIAYVSKFFVLKKGDLIFTGTPKGVGPVAIDDRLVGKIGDRVMFDFEIK